MEAASFGSRSSPCIGVCRLDAESGLCLGCRRTLPEIAAWPGLAPAERAAILRRLRAHKAAAGGNGSAKGGAEGSG